MTDFNEYENENRGETPETASEPVPEEPAEARVDGEYRFVRPDAERESESESHAYSDAGYVASNEASTVPKSYYSAPAAAPRAERKPKKPKKPLGAAAVVALCLVCALLGGVVGGVVPGLMKTETPTEQGSSTGDGTVINQVSSTTSPVTTKFVTAGDELTATEIYYDLALSQVVGVRTEITYTNFWGYTSSSAVSGSGFIISADGYILTNYHVIEDAVKGGYDVQVLTYDGTQYIADIIGYEEDNDVAVLKIDGSGFHAATIGDSDSMKVGEAVYAVGNPLGELEYTMTDGIVSALDREISTYDSDTRTYTNISMFQISAAINQGNSGGPVYNSRGEVIGIASAKYSDTGVESLGFAIPINDAVKIAKDLISDGYVRGKASLGITVGSVSASAAQYYGLVQGAIVNTVQSGSAADKAGVQPSDIIVAMDSYEITGQDDLIAAKKNYSAGDTATLRVYRGGSYVELTITFDEETPSAAATEDNTQSDSQDLPNGSYSHGNMDSYFGGIFGNRNGQ